MDDFANFYWNWSSGYGEVNMKSSWQQLTTDKLWSQTLTLALLWGVLKTKIVNANGHSLHTV